MKITVKNTFAHQRISTDIDDIDVVDPIIINNKPKNK